MNCGLHLIEEEMIEIFTKCGALQEGHYEYASGRHGGVYVNKNLVIACPSYLRQLCQIIAQEYAGLEIQAVAAPATGGIALTQWVADFLTGFNNLPPEKQVLALYAEKDGEKLVFSRQYDQLLDDKRVLVLEDIVTTGGSLNKLIRSVEDCGGQVIGGAVLWNRGGIEFDVPTISLVQKQYPSWLESECPLCRVGVPLNTDLGHAKK